MGKRRVRSLDLLAYLPVRGALTALKWLPERFVYRTFATLGRLFFRVASRRRKIALGNLGQALGGTADERERRRIGGSACGNVGKVVVDIARLQRYVRNGTFRSRVDASELEAAIARARELGDGRPIIFCTPHLGSWEVAGGILGVGRRVHIIMRPLGNPYLNRLIVQSRALLGQKLHPRRGGIRELKRALESGDAAAFLPDQNQRLRGVFVPFFGKLASCDRGPVSLALMGDYPIAVGAAIRLEEGFRFKVRMTDVFLPSGEEGKNRHERLYNGILRINRAVEKLVLECPDQYFWFHDRFRTRPPEERHTA